MRAQRHNLTIARNVVTVVEQQADANAALRRAQYAVHQHLAGVIVLNNEVLEIERPLRRAGQFGSQQKSIHALRHQPESSQPGVRTSLGVYLSPKASGF